ncbi:apolipoprotein L1 isoform X2 [Engraulis encrasicolus]|uniref:apolipoprotein L1 isoform X2 n=1 Tax=Engraulis encrasicolus TaxID=184585 RepID=UPI002FCEFED3
MEWGSRYETLDLDCDEGTKMEKPGVFTGMFKRSSKISESPGLVQEQNGNLSKSSDEISETSSIKEKAGVFGMFKKSSKSSQDNLSDKLSDSSDSLNDNNNTKEKGGVFSGILKKTSKPADEAQMSFGDNREKSASHDSLSEKTSSKEKGGVFSGMFRKTAKPPGGSDQSTLVADEDMPASNDGLSEGSTNKEKSGLLSGMFKKTSYKRAASQENLCDQSSMSGSKDSLSENSHSKGAMGKILRNPFSSTAQDKDKEKKEKQENASDSDAEETSQHGKHKQNAFAGAMSKLNPFRPASKGEKESEKDDEKDDPSSDGENHSHRKQMSFGDNREKSASHDSLSEKTSSKEKGGVFSGMFRKTAKPPGDSDQSTLVADEDMPASNDGLSDHSHRKQNVVVGALTKLNPFRSAGKKHSGMDSEDELEQDIKETDASSEGKDKAARTPLVPPRPTEKELSKTTTYNQLRRSATEDSEANGNMTQRENKSLAKPPPVPPKPKERIGVADRDESARRGSKEEEKGVEETSVQSATQKAKKPNPFTAQPKPLAQKNEQEEVSGDDYLEGESDDGLEDRKEVTTDDKNPDQEAPATKPKKKKKGKKKAKNPFLAHVATKGKTLQKKTAEEEEDGGPGGGLAEKSLFEQLDELRVDKPETEEQNEDKDLDCLIEWWNNVEQWEDAPEIEDMTEKEEAKAFAVTAEKVQKGIRVFNKLFTERAEGLWQHVIDLNGIADGLDKFNKRTKIAQITGGSTSAIGGVATIAGLALAPVTMGTSLIVTAVGLGVATAGGLTSASAGISNQVNNSLDRKKVERIVEDYKEKMGDLNKCMKFIKQGIEHLRKFDLMKMKDQQSYNQEFPTLSSSFFEDGAMVGKALLINANEIMRVVQIANVAGRAVQIASMATGILTGLFVGMDIYFVAKDSKELKKGAKSEFAGKIREIAEQLHGGLVELNTIREELQAATGGGGGGGTEAGSRVPETIEEEEVDEIEEIKRKIKSVPLERREEYDDIDEIKRKLKGKSAQPPKGGGGGDGGDDGDDIDKIKAKNKH